MCGITAIIRRELSEDNSQKSSNLFPELYESLFHLQHRGQDSVGICTFRHMDEPILLNVSAY